MPNPVKSLLISQKTTRIYFTSPKAFPNSLVRFICWLIAESPGVKPVNKYRYVYKHIFPIPCPKH
jgi:hypothetical protein